MLVQMGGEKGVVGNLWSGSGLRDWINGERQCDRVLKIRGKGKEIPKKGKTMGLLYIS